MFILVGTGELSACTQAGAATAAFNSIQQAADAAKVPFLPVPGTAHQHPLGCKSKWLDMRLVSLLGHLWRGKGPERGLEKLLGNPRGETRLGLGTGHGAPQHNPANH